MITVYTDGGCRKNPGIGAWAAYIEIEEQPQFLIGAGLPSTTNNQMELTAPIQAILFLQKKQLDAQQIKIYCDSQYVINCVTLWIKNWIKNKWQTADQKPVKNRELIQELYQLIQNKNISLEWVKGHAGVKGNEICDQAANIIMDEIEQGNTNYTMHKHLNKN